MKNIEGQINIDIFPQRKNASRVEITSSRPLHVTKLLVGKTPAEALSIIPLIFSVCGIAQTRAALAAIEQNLDMTINPALETARDMLVLVENTKEHLCRLFIDWPKLFRQDINNNNLPYLSQMIPEYRSALFQHGDAFSFNSKLNDELINTDYLIDKLEQYLQTHVFSCSTADWLKINDISSLHQWALQSESLAAKSLLIICEQGWASQGLTNCDQLPALDNNRLLTTFDAEDAQQFIARPEWDGACYETTVLTRQFAQPLIVSLYKEFNNTLITRWTARLVELANTPQRLRAMLKQLSENDPADQNTVDTSTPAHHIYNGQPGIKQVEAARGRLIHRVKIEQGVISRYQILAPTEWNFHPRGLAAKTLQGLINGEQKDMDQIAHLLINAIDPCVSYQLKIH